jgi:hypothetical protein
MINLILKIHGEIKNSSATRLRDPSLNAAIAS